MVRQKRDIYIALVVVICFVGFVSAAEITLTDPGRENKRILNLNDLAEAITSFLGLSDTPTSYSGFGGDCVKVNSGETGLVFGNCSNATGGGAGDITAVNTDGIYLTGGAVTGDVDLLLDEAVLNGTIDSRSLNQTEGDTRYVNIDGDNMTGNLDLGSNNITDIMKTIYNTTGCAEDAEAGVVCWNNDKSTLNIVTGLGNVIQVGQEMVQTVRNIEGSTIYNGQIVYISGSQGEIPTAKLADASNGSEIHSPAMVTIASCNDNAACPVTTVGLVHDLDTSAFAEGALLYLETDGSGNFTDTVPKFPNYTIHIGEIIRSHASTGIVLYLPEIDFGDGITINSLGVLTNLTVIGKITAGDWTNVTITESQISDLSHNTYTNGSGISITGFEINHSDTSSQASSDNSGNTFIQDIVLDGFGHITSLVVGVVDFSDIFTSITGNRTESETNLRIDIDGNWSDLEDRKLNITDQRFNNTDTNETARFENLVTDDCTAGNLVIGVQANGTVLCATDATGADLTNVAFINDTQIFAEEQNFSESLNVDQNVTANWFFGIFNWVIGTGSNFLTFNGTTLDLDVIELNDNFNQTDLALEINSTTNIEALGFTQGAHTTDTNASTICSGDEVLLGDGTCTSSSGFGGGGGNDGLFVNYTLTKTTGNITNGSLVGYTAADEICNVEVATGSHMCQMHEIISSVRILGFSNFTATFRASEGAPGFTTNANDCIGWRDPTTTFLGSIWVGNSNNGGQGALVSCSTERAIGCCI